MGTKTQVRAFVRTPLSVRNLFRLQSFSSLFSYVADLHDLLARQQFSLVLAFFALRVDVVLITQLFNNTIFSNYSLFF